MKWREPWFWGLFPIFLLACNKRNDLDVKAISKPDVKSLAKTVTDITITIKQGIDLEADGVSFHCIGGGPVCEIIITTTTTNAFVSNPALNGDIGDTYGVLGIDEAGEVFIKFHKPSLGNAAQYFASGVFELDNPFKISANLANALGLGNENVLIPAGDYNYTEDDNFLIVKFWFLLIR